MNDVSDLTLTEDGYEAPPEAPAGRLLLLACGALAREVLALIRLNGCSHMELRCLPAKLHLFPEQIPEAADR